MKRFHRGLAVCLAAFHAGVGWGQAAHRHDPPGAGEKKARPMSSAAPQVPPSAAPLQLDSVFSDYRRFNADEPLVDWRAANEEVKSAGGHVGLMRATATHTGKARPDARQPVPDASHKGHHK